jgi:hypothetical protein
MEVGIKGCGILQVADVSTTTPFSIGLILLAASL